MGSFAREIQRYLREQLAARRPETTWEVEYRVGGTPVDVGGHSAETLVLLELEWRRADPADNTAKLFRHVAENSVTAERVFVLQLFTRYYDLVNGGVSSKRKNAEFVGRTAADAFERVHYSPLDFDIEPPKRGGEPPNDWRSAADAVVETVTDRLGEATQGEPP